MFPFHRTGAIDDLLTEILQAGARSADCPGGRGGVRDISGGERRSGTSRRSPTRGSSRTRSSSRDPDGNRAGEGSQAEGPGFRRDAGGADAVHLQHPAEMGAAHEVPRRLASRPLPARDFGGRLPGGPGGLARHGRSHMSPAVPVDADNVENLAAAGRARWKIENETFNTLKTKGYNLEHNFGHGKNNLSAVLATLNLIAFAIHLAAELADKTWKVAINVAGSKSVSSTTCGRYRLPAFFSLMGQPPQNPRLSGRSAASVMTLFQNENCWQFCAPIDIFSRSCRWWSISMPSMASASPKWRQLASL